MVIDDDDDDDDDDIWQLSIVSLGLSLGQERRMIEQERLPNFNNFNPEVKIWTLIKNQSFSIWWTIQGKIMMP